MKRKTPERLSQERSIREMAQERGYLFLQVKLDGKNWVVTAQHPNSNNVRIVIGMGRNWEECHADVKAYLANESDGSDAYVQNAGCS